MGGIDKEWQKYTQIGHDLYFSGLGVAEGLLMIKIGYQYKTVADEISIMNQADGC